MCVEPWESNKNAKETHRPFYIQPRELRVYNIPGIILSVSYE